jgi:D-alanyl-D-alanine carboxypeptidase/D-alanyl-D-alanine-endopeptidase (penicillin-binding protein 4)
VDGPARSGAHPGGLTEVASVRSATLIGLVRHMATYSDNFEAEVLGKRLGLERSGPPGSISRGAAGIAAWATSHGVGVAARDASGLSYQNRVSASGVAVLLGAAEEQVWGQALRTALPGGGSGTLGRRLHGVPVRAKTGTLSGISALSGWVWLERRGTWAEFSILSRGLSKSRAIRIEDAIVRKLVAKGR